MINLEQARQELEAICDNDTLFLADEDTTYPSALIGYIVRQCRKKELLESISLAKRLSQRSDSARPRG